MDWYTCVQSLAILAAIEVCVVLWVYGCGKPIGAMLLAWVYSIDTVYSVEIFRKNVELVTNVKVPVVFEYMWMTITPILVVVIMVFSLAGYSKITYGDYQVDTI